MRALKALSLILSLLVSPPVLASDACKAVVTKASQKVGPKSLGYNEVIVRALIPFRTPKADDEMAKNAFFQFSIEDSGRGIRQNVAGGLADIGVCARDFMATNGRFFTGGTVWLRVFGTVESTDDDSYMLESKIVLPESLVTRKPTVRTWLNNGYNYTGAWEEDDHQIVLMLRPQT